MTGFERCALTVIAHVYLLHIPDKRSEFGGTRFRVYRFNGNVKRSMYVNKISWNTIDFRDENLDYRVFDETMHPHIDYIQWKTQERPYNYMYFDHFDPKNKIIKGSESMGGRFQARVVGYDTIEINDSESSYARYIITT